jgi:hypothetical protein
MELKIEKYVSEVHSELSEFIEKNNKILIESPTESGKSTFIKRYIKANPDKHIIFAAPTQILVDNLGDNESIRCGYGKEFLSLTNEKESIITTWDSLGSGIYKKNIPYIVFIDEAHLIPAQADFRRITKLLLELKCKTIFVTGTPEVIDKLPEFEKVTITSKSRKKRNYKIIKTKNKPLTTIKNIIKNRNKKNLTILRINNKAYLQQIQDENKNNLSVAMYYSTNKESGFTIDELEEIQGSELTKKIKIGIIPKEVDLLLATSIIDTGLTLKVHREVDLHSISNKTDRMPNAIDSCQLPYRVRSGQGVINYFIYGNFGDEQIEDKNIDYNSTKTKLDVMSSYYKRYAEIGELEYIGILEYYGCFLDTISDEKKIKTISLSSVRPIVIANNLNSFPIPYSKLEKACQINNTIDWLETLKPSKNLTSSNSTKAIVVCNLMIEAVLNQIHFNLFMQNNKFFDKKLKNLLQVKSLYSNVNIIKDLINVVLECYLDNSNESFNIDNNKFNNLIKNEKEVYKTFVNLLFKADRFDRNTLKLSQRVNSKEVKNYVTNLIKETNQFKLAC